MSVHALLGLTCMMCAQVGNMIGFYVVTCDVGKDAKFNDGKAGLIAETDFVPLHQGERKDSWQFPCVAPECTF
jgi:hypothetical protein